MARTNRKITERSLVMYFKHIYEKGLAQASYFIGCQATGDAIVIDPKRDIQEYLDLAEQEKMRIKYVTETHIHADFLSGARELAAATGAELLLSDEGGADWQYQFSHVPLKDKDTFKVGNLKFEVLHTPGHTPEHISFLLTDTAAASIPIMIFTGDFVFVGDIGRPDLLEKAAGVSGTKEEGARTMFQSLKKFRALPDHIQVWPGHGAGSACGKALGAVPSSTVGYEKLVNWGLLIDDEEKFVKMLLDGQPEPPKYFAMMKKLNKTGPNVLGKLPEPVRLDERDFLSLSKAGVTIVDTRNKISFAGGHYPGSINIQDNSAFSTWAGWTLGYDEDFVLITSEERIEELVKALVRIGLDNVKGYFCGLEKLNDHGIELETMNQITVHDLYENINDYYIVDVRGESEYMNGAINEAELNIHAGYMRSSLDKIPRDRKVVLHCAGGDRSSVAASIVLANGFRNVYNLTGGINAWIQSGYPVVKKETELV